MTTEALAFQQPAAFSAGAIFQGIVSLAIVLAVIWVIAKYLLPKLKIPNSGKIIQIVDRVYLEPQVTSYILKAGHDSWLVVVSNKQIAKIDKVNLA
jgi:flagellar biogenesis protein FliO